MDLTRMLNDFDHESYLEEYLEDFKRGAPLCIRNISNYNLYLKRCEEYCEYKNETPFELSLDFFVMHNIKFASSPTIFHFYDFRKYCLEIKTRKAINGVTLEDLEQYAYLYAVSNNYIRGITKKEISDLEENEYKKVYIVDGKNSYTLRDIFINSIRIYNVNHLSIRLNQMQQYIDKKAALERVAIQYIDNKYIFEYGASRTKCVIHEDEIYN